jgi:hypothetical protein
VPRTFDIALTAGDEKWSAPVLICLIHGMALRDEIAHRAHVAAVASFTEGSHDDLRRSWQNSISQCRVDEK